MRRGTADGFGLARPRDPRWNLSAHLRHEPEWQIAMLSNYFDAKTERMQGHEQHTARPDHKSKQQKRSWYAELRVSTDPIGMITFL